jgi:hypothetical protein
MSLILSGTDGLSDVDGSAATPAIRGTDANTGIFFPAADTIAFSEGGAEAMRLDSSGNLGLGVTPSAWSGFKVLEMSAVGSTVCSAGSTDIRLTGNAYFNGTNWKYAATNLASMYSQNSGIHDWYIAASGSAGANLSWTTAMTLNASGNLGLGVTPSAWNASSAIDMQEGMSYSRKGYSQNLYWDGTSYRYKTTAAASLYQTSAGVYVWYNAASGTAGNTISFTQAMTLDASGNLGIGITNPSTPLHVQGNSSGLSLRVQGRSSDGYSDISLYNNANTVNNAFFCLI